MTCNINSTEKPEIDAALILFPLLHQCSVLRVFKATYKVAYYSFVLKGSRGVYLNVQI